MVSNSFNRGNDAGNPRDANFFGAPDICLSSFVFSVSVRLVFFLVVFHVLSFLYLAQVLHRGP